PRPSPTPQNFSFNDARTEQVAGLPTAPAVDARVNPILTSPGTEASDAGAAVTAPTTPADPETGDIVRFSQAPAAGAAEPVAPPSAERFDSSVAPLPGVVTGPAVGEAADIQTAGPVVVSRLPAEVSDGWLLQRFVAKGEQSAFTALVQRHERLVLNVCQRVLGDSHAAHDAFQATFLVLARKASVIDARNPLAGWLYKVAYHIALRLRAVAARQRRDEKEAAADRSAQIASEAAATLEQEELREALSEELQRLPEKYRTPLVLCYFDGQTHAEAARAIGLPRGSMAKRIGEGLERLRARLLDRGFLF